jgi:hypothetical protein
MAVFYNTPARVMQAFRERGRSPAGAFPKDCSVSDARTEFHIMDGLRIA